MSSASFGGGFPVICDNALLGGVGGVGGTIITDLPDLVVEA